MSHSAMFARPFNPARWLASYEAAGGRLAVTGAGALTRSLTPAAERLEAKLYSDRRRWVAVYQLAAARGPLPRGLCL